MELTRAYIDSIAPEHGRTSCNDENRNNGFYSIKEETLRGVTVRLEFETHPRCNRCLLLELLHEKEIGIPIDPRLVIETDVRISLKQPEFVIVQK